jgi:hypothetical protein
MHELLNDLAVYVTALTAGAAAAKRPEERADYSQRLAAAAEIFAAIHRADRTALRRLIEQEVHGAGWGFLPGSLGSDAETAFSDFVRHARMSGATSAPNMRLKLSGLLLKESAVASPGALSHVGRSLAPSGTPPAA